MSNFVHENSTAEGIALAHTVYGDPVGDTGRPNSTQEGVALATFSAFSPYKKPRPERVRDKVAEHPPRFNDVGKQMCSHPDCGTYSMKDVPYCPGHARSLGFVKNWGGKREPR